MSGKKTPLQVVNEEHGGKNKLVDMIVGLVDRDDEDKDSLKARLLKAPNKKLLRLAVVSSTIKEKYGSTAKLVELVAQKLNHAKDSDFVSRLAAFSPAKLLDLVRSLTHEARRPMKVGLNPPKAVPLAAKRKVVAKAPLKKGGGGAKHGGAKKTASRPAAKKSGAKKPGKR